MTYPRLLMLTAGLMLWAGPPAVATAQPPDAAQAAPASLAGTGNAERGRYIVERVAMCVECHSGRGAAGTIVPRDQYMGAPIPFRPPAGWADRAPRIAGLPGYTEGEALRLLMRGAIGRDGVVLRPPMPRFRMSETDALDVIAFLRSSLSTAVR